MSRVAVLVTNVGKRYLLDQWREQQGKEEETPPLMENDQTYSKSRKLEGEKRRSSPHTICTSENYLFVYNDPFSLDFIPS